MFVSGPSQGMGGFLRLGREQGTERRRSFRPLSRYGWGPTQVVLSQMKQHKILFPAPLEVWVGSYKQPGKQSTHIRGSFRPLSRYGWGPTSNPKYYRNLLTRVSGPYRGMVVSYELEEAGFGKVFKFPAPIEVWVVS